MRGDALPPLERPSAPGDLAIQQQAGHEYASPPRSAPAYLRTAAEQGFGVRSRVDRARRSFDSQAHDATRIDWRRSQGCDMYSIGEMSPAGSRLLLEFHRRARLTYAAYDFIVTPSGDEVFVECNLGGQWLWLENELNTTRPPIRAVSQHARQRRVGERRRTRRTRRRHPDPRPCRVRLTVYRTGHRAAPRRVADLAAAPLPASVHRRS